MNIFESILVVVLFLLPMYEWLQGDKTKRQLLANEITKVRSYKETIVFLLLPTLLLIVAVWFGELTLKEVTTRENKDATIGFLLLGALLIYFVYSLWDTSKNQASRQKIKQQMSELAWFMPTDKKELGWFTGGVSVAAGICEELLFRGFLIYFFEVHIGLTAAVLLSSVLFGLCHRYQGWSNVLRTGLVGLALALVYLWSGSLLLVVVLHFALDAYAGLLFYICHKEVQPSKDSVTT